jgi:hypothetical protein
VAKGYRQLKLRKFLKLLTTSGKLDKGSPQLSKALYRESSGKIKYPATCNQQDFFLFVIGLPVVHCHWP